MIFDRLHRVIARGRAGDQGPRWEPPALPPELEPVAGMLSGRFSPPTEFVRALELRLTQAPVAGRRGTPLAFPSLRPAWIVRIAAIAAALTGMAVALLLLSDRGSRPEVANAMVLADAAEKLLGLHTVRYETRAEVSHGVCYTAYGAPLTSEEKAALAARGEALSDTGIVYGCFPGPQVMSEIGVYDLDRSAFSATMRLVQGETGIKSISGPGPYAPRDRMFVDGKLYVRESGGDWRIQPTQNRWMPFSFEGFGQVPAGSLDALRAQYDQVIKLGEERLEGVQVAHFRAIRDSYHVPRPSRHGSASMMGSRDAPE